MDDLIRDNREYLSVTGEHPIITATTIPDDVLPPAPPVDPYAAYMAHRVACLSCGYGLPCDEGTRLLSTALEDF